MTYDYHTYWEQETGHVAPLYHHPSDSTLSLNANFSIRYWIGKGAPPNKLVMGIPAYGQSFTLATNVSNHLPGFHEEVFGPGNSGKFTKSAGFLAYYEVRMLSMIKNSL